MQSIKKVPTYIFAILIVTIGMSTVTAVYEYDRSNNLNTDNLNITGSISVSVNGKTLYTQNDIIMNFFNDYLACKLWNDSNGCTWTALQFSAPTSPPAYSYGNPCESTAYDASTTTLYPEFTTAALCSLSAIALSTTTTAPVQGTNICTNIQQGSGLSPALATSTHTYSTGSETLTYSWTYSGSSVTIYTVCMLMYNLKAHAIVYNVQSGSSYSTVNDGSPIMDLLATPVTLTTGQSIGITWTINY